MIDNLPKISLVICTYNRASYLAQTLQTVATQNLFPDFFELIVIDNRSTDNTAEVIQQFMQQHSQLHVRYCFEEQKGLSFARNRGIAEARSSIISYVDDDVLLSENFLRSIIVFFNTYVTSVGMGGKVIPKYVSGQEPAWMSRYLNGFVGKVDYGTEVLQFNKKMKYPAGCNMAYRKNILEAVNGFNTQLTFRSDDKDIFYRVSKVSNEIYYVPNAWLYHYIDEARLSFKNFKTLFQKTGNEEKIRIQKEEKFEGLINKFFEYIFKLLASLLIGFIFLIQGKGIKGKYLIAAQWFTLTGFLKKNVFVR
jgi:glycosyltransferase involved in cell wall biosynthesis